MAQYYWLFSTLSASKVKRLEERHLQLQQEVNIGKVCCCFNNGSTNALFIYLMQAAILQLSNDVEDNREKVIQLEQQVSATEVSRECKKCFLYAYSFYFQTNKQTKRELDQVKKQMEIQTNELNRHEAEIKKYLRGNEAKKDMMVDLVVVLFSIYLSQSFFVQLPLQALVFPMRNSKNGG